MKRFFGAVLIISAYILFSQKAFASYETCQPVYGGGQTCVQGQNIAVNKTIKNPKTGNFVDNLDINDTKFSPEQTVQFQINVTNTGDGAISKVNVKDSFPQFVNFQAGPGSFDSNTKTLSFEINNLNPNETKTFDVSGKIGSANQLPSDKSITCVINQATASVTETGKTSQDNAEFCIQKELPKTKGGLTVFPPTAIKISPPTGPEMIPLIGLIPTGLAGLLLRRKTKNKISKNMSA